MDEGCPQKTVNVCNNPVRAVSMYSTLLDAILKNIPWSEKDVTGRLA
jgi:hypothetical protein